MNPQPNPPLAGATGSADLLMLSATMLGYVSGVADHGENPYHYMQAEAWCWEHGREQGRQHRVRCDALPPNSGMNDGQSQYPVANTPPQAKESQ